MFIGIGISLTPDLSRHDAGGPPDVVAPILSSPTGVETSPTTADLSVTTDEAGGTVYVSVLPSASAAPSAAAFIAGATGGAFTSLDNSPTVGVIPFTATGLDHSTAYKAHFFHQDAGGNESNIVSSAEFTTDVAPDVTAPILSGGRFVVNSFDTAHIYATTDEANGTIYGYISQSATPPSDADLKAGTGADWAGNLPVTTTGEKGLHATGLEAETEYYGYILHRDAAGNDSNTEETGVFETDAIPSVDAPVLTQTSAAGANPLAFTIAFDDFIIDQDVFEFRHRVNGGSWVTETGQSVTSAWYDDHITDGVPISKPNYAAATFLGGDVVGVEAGITRGAEATVWSTELTDTMAVTDVTFTYGNKATNASATTAVSYSNCAFAGGGRALIFLSCFTVSSGLNSSTPASLTITPSAGGAGINCTLLGSGGRGVGRAVAIYISDSDVAATNYNITGTRPSSSRSNTIMWGTLIGADPTPTSGPTFTSGSGTNPHVTSSLTCPANGLLIGGLVLENSATLAANAGTTLLDQIWFNSEFGLVLGQRDTTGTLSFNSTPNTTFNWGKAIVAFGPA